MNTISQRVRGIASLAPPDGDRDVPAVIFRAACFLYRKGLIIAADEIDRLESKIALLEGAEPTEDQKRAAQ